VDQVEFWSFLRFFGILHHRYIFYIVDYYVADNNFNDLYVYFSILVLKLRYFVKCYQINNGPLHLVRFRLQNLAMCSILYGTKYTQSIVIRIVTAAVMWIKLTWSIQLICFVHTVRITMDHVYLHHRAVVGFSA